MANLVRRAAERGTVVRPVGSCHSSTPLVETPDELLSLENLRGVVGVDEDAQQATILPGTGHTPDGSTGREPEFTSRDELCLLNTTASTACAELTIFHGDRDPVGPYRIEVPARRVKHTRINDLINPEAVPLGAPYGITVVSDVPLVIQLRHLDTRQAELGVAITSGMPGTH